MSKLPWNELVATISIHPDMASREEVARLAAELMEMTRELAALHARDRESEAMLAHQQKRMEAAEANLAAMTDKAGDEFERAEAAEARAARLTEALQFYGDESNYQNETVDIGVGDMLIPSSNRVDNDGGRIARVVLSGGEMK